jgi:DNA invertase Pin-like site-specific DNA recombinase
MTHSHRKAAYLMARTPRTAPATTKAVGYIRVSTDKQADHGISLDAQRTKLEAYAALYDLELVEVIVDAGVSATRRLIARVYSRPLVCCAVVRLRRCWWQSSTG